MYFARHFLESLCMTSHFLQHLKNCSEIVRTWPDWKQSVLGGRAETPPKHVSQSSNPKKAREVWDTIKDLPEIEDILKSLNLVYDGMTWNDHPEMDVSDWHLSQKFECEGKIEIQKYYCLRPELVMDLILGEITRRMGGCPCDERLKGWIVWNRQR